MAINWDQTYDEADRYLKTVGLNESSHTLIRISEWESSSWWR